jgi:hypothetical protein
MVGLKGKSGRHKNDCCCNNCLERKAKRAGEAAEVSVPIQDAPIG